MMGIGIKKNEKGRLMADAKIVVISDDGKIAEDVVRNLSRGEWVVKWIALEESAALMPLESPDCIILALSQKCTSEESVYLKEFSLMDDNLPVIVISPAGRLEHAVSLMKEGAYDYFSGQPDNEKLAVSVQHAIKLYKLTKRVFLLEQQTGWQGRFDDIIGHSAKMQEIFRTITTVAKSNATVLILGESGTGKELVAKAIHRHSLRSAKPFIDINCGAIPRELLENELFGHERGAYTGADKRYIGSCERANGGTLFLDEICEMEPSLQVKILRLLQDRSFMRVGGTEKITSDIRFIAATNRDIEKDVKDGNFREDLYYRLNVVPIFIPPLRDRKEDIILIAKHFLEKYSARNEKIFVNITPEAAELLINYEWPGNVRELENTIERIVVLNNDSSIKPKHLPPKILEAGSARKARVSSQVPSCIDNAQKIVPLELIEKYAIESALEKCGGSVSEAAKHLQIGQATMYRKIRQYGLKNR